MSQDTDISESRKDGTAGQNTDNEETTHAARIKQIVDDLPPLTEEQKDILALIFGARNRN